MSYFRIGYLCRDEKKTLDLMRVLKVILLLLVVILPYSVTFAQSIVKGRIVNSKGQGVEYANLIIGNAHTLSDAKGYFQLSVQDNEKASMTVSHISFETLTVLPTDYLKPDVVLTLEEKKNTLPTVSVSGLKLKEKKIARKGVKLPGDVQFANWTNPDAELGPVVSAGDNYWLKKIGFTVKECTYDNSKLRIIIYEIRGNNFIPVMNKPLYVDCGKIEKDRDYNVTVDKGIALYKGHDYYIGMCLVAGSKGGTISFPAYLHNAYARNLLNGNTKKLPASIGVALAGVKMGKQ